MNNLEKIKILKLILEIAESIKYRGLMFNERYLHHFFTNQFQAMGSFQNLNDENATIILHPEWPTYKKQTNLKFGRYKKEGKIYKPNASGTAGFIDFAIGNYNKPYIGIEFSLKYGWSNEEIVYDILKLLDKKNPFTVSISLNIIFRERQLVKGGYLKNLEDHMNKAYKEAISRLNNDKCEFSRELYLIITEIAKYMTKFE